MSSLTKIQPMYSSVTDRAKGFAVADIVAQFRVSRPTLDMVGVQLAITGGATLAGEVIACEDGLSPLAIGATAHQRTPRGTPIAPARTPATRINVEAGQSRATLRAILPLPRLLQLARPAMECRATAETSTGNLVLRLRGAVGEMAYARAKAFGAMRMDDRRPTLLAGRVSSSAPEVCAFAGAVTPAPVLGVHWADRECPATGDAGALDRGPAARRGIAAGAATIPPRSLAHQFRGVAVERLAAVLADARDLLDYAILIGHDFLLRSCAVPRVRDQLTPWLRCARNYTKSGRW